MSTIAMGRSEDYYFDVAMPSTVNPTLLNDLWFNVKGNANYTSMQITSILKDIKLPNERPTNNEVKFKILWSDFILKKKKNNTTNWDIRQYIYTLSHKEWDQGEKNDTTKNYELKSALINPQMALTNLLNSNAITNWKILQRKKFKAIMYEKIRQIAKILHMNSIFG